MELFKDKELLTKEYFEKKPITPEEETLTQQLNLTSLDKKEEEPEVEKVIPGRYSASQVLKDKIVGLYFSAGWCPPCQQFTPLLGQVYDELQNRKSNFAVVFISYDKNEDEMEKYFRSKHRDWFALPFDDPLKEELKIKYHVTAVPRFIVVHRDGEPITLKGRKEIHDKGVICFRNWQQASNIYEAKQSQQVAGSQEGTDTQKEVSS